MRESLEYIVAIVDNELKKVEVNEVARKSVLAFMAKLRLYNVHAMFRPDLLEQVSNDVFSDEDVRTFVFNVQYAFYATAGTGPGFIEALTNTLEDALLIDGPCVDFNMLPPEIKDSMPLTFYKSSKQPNGFLARIRKALVWNETVRLNVLLRNNPIIATLLLLRLQAE